MIMSYSLYKLQIIYIFRKIGWIAQFEYIKQGLFMIISGFSEYGYDIFNFYNEEPVIALEIDWNCSFGIE